MSFVLHLLELGKAGAIPQKHEVKVFDVHASYGHYQIMIGGKHHPNSLEINGAMHHLFVTKSKVTPHPSHHQIQGNLKGVIVLRDLTIHLDDPTGSGKKLAPNSKQGTICAKEKINMAGPEGEQILKRMELTGKLAKETYKIIQEDILNALANKQFSDITLSTGHR